MNKRKLIVIVSAIFFIFSALTIMARFNKDVVDNASYSTTTAFNDSTDAVGLDYESYVGYGLYATSDSVQIIVQTQGYVAGNWVTYKRDTLASTDADGFMSVELRDNDTDYLTGVNIVRLYMNITPDDDDSTGTYSIQMVAR